MQDSEIQWARVAPGAIVVATRARAFLHEDAASLPGSGPFSTPPPGRASLEVTRRLLDAAVGVAQRRVQSASPRPLTRMGWVVRLAGYFHTTHATPTLMREAEARFASEGRSALAAWAARKTRDERGHDVLALRDLASLGYDAPRLVAACVPDTAAALVEIFESFVRGPGDAARSAGYAYALERLAATRSAAEVRAVEAILPEGVDATRCLRVHSAAGSDADHVDDIVALAASLSHEEREAIAAAAFETTCVGRASRGARLDDDALAILFEPFRTDPAA